MVDTESCEIIAEGATGVSGGDYLEVSSCIESLANSGGQLRQLAYQAHQYYAKTLVCYGYTCVATQEGSHNDHQKRIRPTDRHYQYVMSTSTKHQGQDLLREQLEQLASDKNLLGSLSSLVKILPFLNELCSFIERCLVTVESTIKRITYYLNLASTKNSSQGSVKYDNFQLTCDVRLDAIFVALMDLMFALVNLDKTLEDHTTIGRDLSVFQNLVRKLAGNLDEFRSLNGHLLAEHESELLSAKKLVQLDEHIKFIGMTLGATFVKTNPSIFRQCIDRVQHLDLILDKDKSQAGFRLFHEIFERFLVFYSDYLVDVSKQNIAASSNNPKISKTIASILIGTNLIPTTYMTSLTRKLFGLASLSILFNSIFQGLGDGGKRVYRCINQVIQKTKPNNIILLESTTNSHLYLDEFLLLHMPKSSSIEKRSFELLASQMDVLLKTDTNLEFDRLLLIVGPWLSRLKSEALDYELMRCSDWPNRQIIVLDQGLRIANEISTLVRSVPAAHHYKNLAINKHNLVGLYKLSILLKSIQVNMNKHELFISSIILKVEHFIRARWRQLFNQLQKRQVSMKYSERKMDLSSIHELSSLVARSELLSSNMGRILQSICLSMLLPVLDQKELHDLNQLMDLMRWQFLDRLHAYTDCSHLYWHIPTIGVYYNYAFEELNGAINEVNLLHLALGDVHRVFTPSSRPSWSQVDLDWLHLEREKVLQRLSVDLLEHFKNDYLDRVCQELEIELRLRTHKFLYSSEPPSESEPSFGRNVYDFKQLLSNNSGLPTVFSLLNHRINLNFYVEQYLDKICYELTALAPHDWFFYDNMMNLARHKYGLKFVNTQLPAQSLDSGLDLLDIIRNLSLFASRYSYDLTSQLFIEKCSSRTSVASTIQSINSNYAGSSSNQLLNTIQSHHIAQSIQTHGYGTLDSAVNCTYQTLKRLINLFSRQLSDDKLRAVLQKEYQRMVAEAKSRPRESTTWTLSFDKANRMAKQFRLNINLLSEQSNSTTTSVQQQEQQQQQQQPLQSPSRVDLDSIRQTVTQIGNLLAFVRLIKNGALTSASRSVDYVPDVSDLANLRLTKCVEHEFADYETQKTLLEAAKNFDQCLDDFEENFSPKTNYSKIIVGLFKGLLSNKDSRENEPQKNATTTNGSTDEAQKTPPDSMNHSTSESNEQISAGNNRTNKSRSDHLELFFVVIPALIINYIDHLINCKERASSRSSAVRFGALLFDDGFPIGIAFLLTVLSQTHQHNKLDWLNQTCLRLQRDIGEVDKRLKDPKYDESLKQTSSMTLKRLSKLHSEYVALEHTLTCALLLFENLS